MVGKGRILVVDDNPANVRFVTAKLESHGFVCSGVGSGEAALEQVAGGQPDLVLLDILMPGMDGYDVTRRLKGEPATARLPIVLLTAMEEEEARQRGLAAGADEFLSKPVATGELLARVSTMIKLAWYREQLASRKGARRMLVGESTAESTDDPSSGKNPMQVVIATGDERSELGKLLESMGARVETVLSGESLLSRVESEAVDAVLLRYAVQPWGSRSVCHDLREAAGPLLPKDLPGETRSRR